MNAGNFPPHVSNSDWARYERDQEDYETEPVSACCGAKIIWEDICDSCREHCEPQTLEED